LVVCVALILVGLTAVSLEGGTAAQSSARTPRAPQSTPAPAPAAVERQLLEAVQRAPDSFEARHRLAGFYLQQGKVTAAIPQLQRAQQIDPSHYAVGYDLAVALIDVGRLDEARKQVGRLIAAKDSGEVQNLLGDLEERAGNLVAAAEAYQRASHMDPSEENLFDWGDSLLQLRAAVPAGEVFTAAVKRHPRSARLYVGLGISLYSRGEYRDAVEAFCQAADLAPSDPRPYQFLGEMYGVSPEVSGEVSRRLGRFVETHPKDALAHFHYAMSLWKGSQATLDAEGMRRVEALLRRAVTLDPRLAKGFFELGVLLADQDRHAEAIDQLRRATALEPSLAQAHYRLALLYQRTGQPDLAARERQTFRQLTGKGGDDR
jgi:tetratricopeptide (TPR) repeat protein